MASRGSLAVGDAQPARTAASTNKASSLKNETCRTRLVAIVASRTVLGRATSLSKQRCSIRHESFGIGSPLCH